MLVTLVSITETKGPLKSTVAPKNGGIVVADMKFEGKTAGASGTLRTCGDDRYTVNEV